MPVSALLDSLTLCREEACGAVWVCALDGEWAEGEAWVGEVHMPIPSPPDMAPLSLTQATVIHITLQATCRIMDIHRSIREPLAAGHREKQPTGNTSLRRGEQNAIRNGARWLGVHDTLRLPLRRLAIPDVALVRILASLEMDGQVLGHDPIYLAMGSLA